jgi:predicted  nucleic acid-binding Zn-ribbon protein
MNTFDKNMEKIFDVAPVEQKEQPLVPISKSAVNESDLKQDLKDAYDQTKSNLQDLIDNGKDAMEELRQIASSGQHPRAFEVYATLLKNVVDANKELLNVQKQMRDMDGKKKDGDTRIDKAIFIGSTAELSKLVKGKE